jgi:hypothetical protein
VPPSGSQRRARVREVPIRENESNAGAQPSPAKP